MSCLGKHSQCCPYREARPIDLDAIKALKESMRQRDDKVDELLRRLADIELSRQQLQEEMQLREKNWLANGNMRVGPSLDEAQGLNGKQPPKSNATSSSRR